MIATSGHRQFATIVLGWLAAILTAPAVAGDVDRSLLVSWNNEILTIRGKHLPGGALEVWYIEAFCRPGSTRRDWKQTVIPHQTHVVAAGGDGRWIKLRSELTDGVLVDHEIRAGRNVVDFRVVATNPTNVPSQAHWAQPCVRVDRYAGTKAEHAGEAYLPRCFIYTRGKRSFLPTEPWARNALYTPGQVWCPEGVSREDVNPRPLSEIVPSNGLIGCVSADGKELVAMAWAPYQELFQGVIVCLHSDFRIGGLEPGQSKTIRGKIYLMPADFPELEARYRRDFPTQERGDAAAETETPAKKLIEFGWDEPDTSFLRRHHAQLQQSPFDGCVFHVLTANPREAKENFTWLAWGRRRFTRTELQPAIDDLRSLTGSKFRHHFLRFNVTPADLDWFDDHAAILANARLAAEMSRAGGCAGILLDTEQYQGALFDLRRQRDRSRHSWQDYAAQARKRGREVMTAFQDGFPDLTVLVTFGYSLLWKESQAGRKPLADCADGLLVPFLDGLVEAARGKTKLVDGHELSYGYRDASAYRAAREVIDRHAATLAADRERYHRVVSAGFGLWLDYDWRNKGWHTDQLERNYFSPERLEASLRAAVEQSNEYVWIYTEKPRWWSEQGVAVDLPGAYVETVRRVRRALLDD
ncbi:MAG: hypothetical protein ACLQIB_09800 [Isosphaeraceae bacterium]